MAENNKTQPPASPPPLQGISNHQGDDMLEADEHVLTVVKRSVIGLVATYLVAFLAIAAITALIITMSPETFKTSSASISGTLMLAFFVAAILLVLILYTATYIYRQSRLLLTDKSLVQISQKTLFNRQVSRLSMSNVEDVKCEQRGLISSLFNYGTLTVQTAGTEDNFIFTLCPNPNQIADQVIEARQNYAKNQEEEREEHLAEHLKAVL